MRTMDLFLAFPYLLLAIIIVSALGPGIRNTIIAIGIWTVPTFARIARGAVAGLRDRACRRLEPWAPGKTAS